MKRNNGGGLLRRIVSRIGMAAGLARGVPLGLREAIEGPAEPIDPTTRFESGDLNAKAVFLTGVGVLLGLWVVVVLVYPYFTYLAHERAGGAPAAEVARPFSQYPPEPRIQANPTSDLNDFRAWEATQLNSYQWVDRDHNVVSIPIEQAIKIVVQRGIPPQPDPGGKLYFDPHTGTRLTGFEGKVEPEPR